MSRGLTTAVSNAVAAAEVRPAIFAFLDLVGGAVRVWSGSGNQSLGGNTYSGIGTFGGISGVSESTKLQAHGIDLSLSGVPSAYVTMILSEDYRRRPVYVWAAFFDSSSVMIADEVLIFAGRIDTMSLQDGGDTSMITITAESCLIDLERPRELRYTNEEQQRLYPGDLGLEYVPSIQSTPLYWGSSTSSQPAPKPSAPFIRRTP